MIPITVSSDVPYAPGPAKEIDWPDSYRKLKCFSPLAAAGGAALEKKSTASSPISPYLPVNFTAE
jgi:hypothetical protein